MRSGSQKIRVSRGRVPVGDGSAPGAGGYIGAGCRPKHRGQVLAKASGPGADGNIKARRWVMHRGQVLREAPGLGADGSTGTGC